MAKEPEGNKRPGLLDAMDDLERQRKNKRAKAEKKSKELDFDDVWS